MCSVSTLRDLAEEHTGLRPADIDHLHRIAGDWQLLSDLSFADLLLWVPVDGDGTFLCVAQVRPTTAPTAYQDDQVGRIVGGPEVAHLDDRLPPGPDLAGGRPGLVRRHARPARGDPGPAAHRRRGGRRGDRGGRPGHQPLHRADARASSSSTT